MEERKAPELVVSKTFSEGEEIKEKVAVPSRRPQVLQTRAFETCFVFQQKPKKVRECIFNSVCRALDHTIRERFFVRRFFVKTKRFLKFLIGTRKSERKIGNM